MVTSNESYTNQIPCIWFQAVPWGARSTPSWWSWSGQLVGKVCGSRPAVSCFLMLANPKRTSPVEVGHFGDVWSVLGDVGAFWVRFGSHGLPYVSFTVLLSVFRFPEAARAFTRLDDLAKEEAAAIAATPLGARRRQGYVPKKHGAAPARREVLVSGKSWDGPKAGFGEQCLVILREQETKPCLSFDRLQVQYVSSCFFVPSAQFSTADFSQVRCGGAWTHVRGPAPWSRLVIGFSTWRFRGARCAMKRSEGSGMNLEVKSNTERLSAWNFHKIKIYRELCHEKQTTCVLSCSLKCVATKFVSFHLNALVCLEGCHIVRYHV